MSSQITKFRTLTNEELLSRIDEKREHSKIIEELCQRLESSDKLLPPEDGSNGAVTCPTCECALQIGYDHENQMFTVEQGSPQ